MADKQPSRSADEIEADIKSTRNRLAGTVDELAHRASPGEIKRRQTEKLKAKANDAVYTPQGDLRLDRFAMVLGTVAAVALALGLARRTFRR